MGLTELFVNIDDFWKQFRPGYEQHLLADGTRRRRREGRLSVSEIMTLLVTFETSNYRTFKHFYNHIAVHHRHDFPDLVSYHRLIELIGRATMPLFAYLQCRCLGQVTGISFIDSTALKVCGNKRITRHRVFDGLAAISGPSARRPDRIHQTTQETVVEPRDTRTRRQRDTRLRLNRTQVINGHRTLCDGQPAVACLP